MVAAKELKRLEEETGTGEWKAGEEREDEGEREIEDGKKKREESLTARDDQLKHTMITP